MFLPFRLYNSGQRAAAVQDSMAAVLESSRIELLDPRDAAVAQVICEAQWRPIDRKVFISWLQFTISSA